MPRTQRLVQQDLRSSSQKRSTSAIIFGDDFWPTGPTNLLGGLKTWGPCFLQKYRHDCIYTWIIFTTVHLCVQCLCQITNTECWCFRQRFYVNTVYMSICNISCIYHVLTPKWCIKCIITSVDAFNQCTMKDARCLCTVNHKSYTKSYSPVSFHILYSSIDLVLPGLLSPQSILKSTNKAKKTVSAFINRWHSISPRT